MACLPKALSGTAEVSATRRVDDGAEGYTMALKTIL